MREQPKDDRPAMWETWNEPRQDECPTCGGLWQTLLGVLGHLTHFRCRECGQTWCINRKLLS